MLLFLLLLVAVVVVLPAGKRVQSMVSFSVVPSAVGGDGSGPAASSVRGQLRRQAGYRCAGVDAGGPLQTVHLQQAARSNRGLARPLSTRPTHAAS